MTCAAFRAKLAGPTKPCQAGRAAIQNRALKAAVKQRETRAAFKQSRGFDSGRKQPPSKIGMRMTTKCHPIQRCTDHQRG